MFGSKKNKETKWVDSIAIVIAIVAFILLIGLIIYAVLEKNKKEKGVSQQQQQKLWLDQIQARIKELEPQKELLIRTEKRYFFWARLTIGCLLFLVNCLYLYFYNWVNFNLGNQLNINGAIVLVYSFAAFILYGSPTRLVNAIKKNASQFFLRKHMHILYELQYLKEQEKELIAYLNQHERK